MADVSGIVRGAHKLTGTGGDALGGKDEGQRLTVESSLVAAARVVVSILLWPKIASENIVLNSCDLPRMIANDKTLKRIDRYKKARRLEIVKVGLSWRCS